MHVQPRAGALLVWVGWALVLGPASYLASYVPLLGGLVIGALQLSNSPGELLGIQLGSCSGLRW